MSCPLHLSYICKSFAAQYPIRKFSLGIEPIVSSPYRSMYGAGPNLTHDCLLLLLFLFTIQMPCFMSLRHHSQQIVTFKFGCSNSFDPMQKQAIADFLGVIAPMCLQCLDIPDQIIDDSARRACFPTTNGLIKDPVAELEYEESPAPLDCGGEAHLLGQIHGSPKGTQIAISLFALPATCIYFCALQT